MQPHILKETQLNRLNGYSSFPLQPQLSDDFNRKVRNWTEALMGQSSTGIDSHDNTEYRLYSNNSMQNSVGISMCGAGTFFGDIGVTVK